ncbi:MAG: tol-pal system protein YbgF [Methylococcaceae bacterium]
MKKLALLLMLSSSLVQAETWELPPVVDNSGYPPQTVTTNPATLATSGGNAVYEMMGRLEQLQKEVQELTGKVEEQAYLIAELKKQQKVMYSDFDDRLQSIENKGSANSAPPDTTSSAPVVPEPAPAPVEQAAEKPVAPPPPPVAPIDASISKKAADAKIAAAKAGVKPPPPPPAPQVPVAEKQDYDSALTALRTGHTSQAIDGFSAYLQKYPTGGYAANAQLHLGEAYHLNNNEDAAQQAFNTLIIQQPKSDKVPDALLMLGTIELAQKHNDKAQEYLMRVIKEFPNSPAALRAAKKLETLQ